MAKRKQIKNIEKLNKPAEDNIKNTELVNENLVNKLDEINTKINEKIKSEVKKSNKEIKTKNCKILRIDKSYIVIDFDGYGISIKNTNNIINGDIKNKDFIEIKYYGEIGKKDFEILA